jgi:2-oxoglutarate dehydrogenase E2 component (dihydrolipoamide succinyltransferase)
MQKVLLPELGSGIEKAVVSFWYFKPGDKINEKEDLVELCTDKATFNLPCPCAGVLLEVLFAEGDTVRIGEVLAIIDTP